MDGRWLRMGTETKKTRLALGSLIGVVALGEMVVHSRGIGVIVIQMRSSQRRIARNKNAQKEQATAPI